LTAGRAVFFKVTFISGFSCVVEFRGGSPAAPEVIVQAVEKPKRPHKFVKIGRHKQGVP